MPGIQGKDLMQFQANVDCLHGLSTMAHACAASHNWQTQQHLCVLEHASKQLVPDQTRLYTENIRKVMAKAIMVSVQALPYRVCS